MKSPTMSSFIKGLESSGWLKHIQSILETSFFIAQAVENGISVLVHCSDGWDRTAQVCSLASLLLDPYYRTINGFQTLIEKDWLAFGHKFCDRFGHLNGDVKELSPILTQFIDTTWQVWNAYPTAFQFNEKFLLTIHDHAASCQFGTFIGNSEKERSDLRFPRWLSNEKLKTFLGFLHQFSVRTDDANGARLAKPMRVNEKTFSLWGHMAYYMNEYLNPLYRPEPNSEFLILNIASQNIKFWRGMYCRFENGIHPREPLNEILLAMVDHSTSMSEHIKFLEKRISQLKILTEAGSDEKMEDEKKNIEEEAEKSEKSFLSKEISSLSINRKEENILAPDTLKHELDSVALDWKTLRNIVECSCTTPFDHSTRKCHCWRCGDVFCTRCIDKRVALPGLPSKRTVPVCRQCYSAITTFPSLDSP